MRTDGATSVRGSEAVHRALEAELVAARERGNVHPRVVDVGGGTGGWAVPLAAAGCAVTVVEPSPNAIATLSMRAEEMRVADRITVIADDVDALGRVVPAGSADLVLAHGLLEVVDDPASAVAALAAAVSPHGAVSVLVANRHAAALHRALSGRFDEASRLLAAPSGVTGDNGETLLRRFDTESLTALLSGAGLRIDLLQGDGVVAESLSDSPGADPTEFELVASQTPPLRDIATRLHVLARRA